MNSDPLFEMLYRVLRWLGFEEMVGPGVDEGPGPNLLGE